MPKNVVRKEGETWFTTEHAADGHNQNFYIYGVDVTAKDHQNTTDCRHIAGLNENGLPPDTPEGWGSIIAAVNKKGCPSDQDPVTFNCSLGLVRSAIVAGIYMIKCLKMSAENAFFEIEGSVGPSWSSQEMPKKIKMYLGAYVKVCVMPPPTVTGKRRSGRLSGSGFKF